MHACDTLHRANVSPHPVIGLVPGAFSEEVKLELRKERRQCIRIVKLDDSAIVPGDSKRPASCRRVIGTSGPAGSSGTTSTRAA
jgi:hypothetical protein